MKQSPKQKKAELIKEPSPDSSFATLPKKYIRPSPVDSQHNAQSYFPFPPLDSSLNSSSNSPDVNYSLSQTPLVLEPEPAINPSTNLSDHPEDSLSATANKPRRFKRRRKISRNTQRFSTRPRKTKTLQAEYNQLLGKAALGAKTIKPFKIKYATLTKYILEKACEICKAVDRNEHELVLCDRCDDAYHIDCAGMDGVAPEIWYCKTCTDDMKQLEEREKEKMTILPENCQKCFQPLHMCTLQYTRPPFSRRMQITDVIKTDPFLCRYCHRYFHPACLNKRAQAINCEDCENKLRKETPKGHTQFMEYIKKCTSYGPQFYNKYKLLSPILQPQEKVNGNTRRKLKFIGLKTPDIPSSATHIIKHESSIFYALATQRMTFSDQQIYPNTPENIEQYNDTKVVEWNVELNQKDQRVFQSFKKQSRYGYYGPMEICEDKIRGFYLRALADIPQRTLLCQYVGEVVTMRQSLMKQHNNSIFSLIRTTHSATSLDICPEKFGNISKYFCGVNNATRKLENTQTMLINYKGHGRIIFFAKRKIMAGEILCIDYNAGAFQEYPTENFQ